MKYTLVFLLFSLIAIKSTATIGCLSNSTTYTYINPEGFNRNGVPSYHHRYASDQRLSSSNFCTSPVVPTQNCYIYATREGWNSSYGTLVDYSTVNNCNLPIDDYIPFLLISIAGVSIYFLRGRIAV
ncbi:MAG: hypothetical protein V4663_00425 [Bacteroidota bacterium]